MKHEITIGEAVAEVEIAAFWEQLRAYYRRDIFPDPKDTDREFFLSQERQAQMQQIHDRPQDPCHYLFFYRDGQNIGVALSVIFTSEDGKCFILDFCVYPEFRGNGTGRACAQALLAWAKARGAHYAELNCGGDQRRFRFWESVGFVTNGVDEWGDALMLLPPKEEVPITVEILTDPEDWQLKKLENGFLQEIGEQTLTNEKQEQLTQAIQAGNITFFMAKRDSRAVGMCSVAKCFSTFACADTGVLDDFYVEPAFRKKGIARQLTQAAQVWSHEQGMSSLTVCCAPCDEKMYQSLGFETQLGTTWAYLR